MPAAIATRPAGMPCQYFTPPNQLTRMMAKQTRPICGVMLKTYELTSRHFGWDHPPKAASQAEILNYLLDRSLRSQALVSLDSICYLNASWLR